MKKYDFTFSLTDGSSYTINDVPEELTGAIWNQLGEYCSMFESETKKVKSVIQKEVR